MCKIPQLGQRLDLLLSVRELPESIRDLEPVSAGALLGVCDPGSLSREAQITSGQISRLCGLAGLFWVFFSAHFCV